MSWIEKIKNGIIITTGDGKQYEPLYIITSREKEYYVAEFNFINISGSLVKREQPKGKRHSFEFTFQGENHLDTSEAFDKSADDTRPWTISHPYYGQLLVQPLSLKHDPTGLNTSVFTGEFVETISEEYPRIGVDPSDKGKQAVSNYRASNVDLIVNEVVPNAAAINQMNSAVSDVYSLGAANVEAGELSNEYFQLFNNAQSYINNSASQLSLAATYMGDMLFFPSSFVVSVKTRLKLLVSQYVSLASGINELFTPNDKKIYEANAGTLISAMVNSALNPISTDYTNAVDVISVIDIILDNYNDLIEGLSNLQTISGGLTDSYVPDYDGIFGLNLAVNFTVSNLMAVSMGAKKARYYILTIDSNPILLAHRFYGLTDEMDNIQKFMDENDIDLPEVLQIKAGREVVYYV